MQTKIIAILILLFTIISFGISTKVNADENRLDIQIEAGINGKAKLEQGFPVFLSITNNSEDFSGDLVITIPKDNQSIGNKVIPIDIAAGTTKQIEFSVPGMIIDILRMGSTKIDQFHLYEGNWQDGNEVAIDSSLEIIPSYIQQDQLAIGVLSNQPDSLNYLKLANFMGNSPEVLVLDEDNIPKTSQGFEVLDLLLINDFAVAQLPEDTQAAINHWVSNGGNLIIGSEPGLEQQMGTLAPLLPMTISGTEKVNEIEKFNQLADQPFEVSEFELFTGEINSGATNTMDENNIPLVVNQNVGKGQISQVNFDIDHPELANWDGNSSLWQTIINQIHKSTTGNSRIVHHYGDELTQLSSRFPSLSDMNVSVLTLLFIGYLLLIVPVLYFVLKRMDKREWAWVAIPLVAILSSIGLYLVGAKDRIGDIKTNAVSILAVNQEGVGSGEGSLSLLSQGSGTYTLAVNQSLNPFPDGNSFNQDFTNLPMIDSEGDESHVHFRNVEFWSPRTVAVDYPQKEYGTFTTNLSFVDEQITGNITNNFDYDFEEVYLLSGSSYETIGSLAVGETKELSFQSNTIFQTPVGDLGNQIFGNSYQAGGQSYDQQLKSQLLNNALRNQMFTEDQLPILVGYTNDSIYKAEVNGDETEQNNVHLITQAVSIQLPENKSVTLESAITIPTVSIIEGQIYYNGLLERGEPFLDTDGGVYQLSYTLPQAFIERAFQLGEIAIDAGQMQGNPGNAVYTIYNVRTGEYEALESMQSLIDTNVQDYLNNNAVILKVDARRGQSIHVPTVNVKGVTNP